MSARHALHCGMQPFIPIFRLRNCNALGAILPSARPATIAALDGNREIPLFIRERTGRFALRQLPLLPSDCD